MESQHRSESAAAKVVSQKGFNISGDGSKDGQFESWKSPDWHRKHQYEPDQHYAPHRRHTVANDTTQSLPVTPRAEAYSNQSYAKYKTSNPNAYDGAPLSPPLTSKPRYREQQIRKGRSRSPSPKSSASGRYTHDGFHSPMISAPTGLSPGCKYETALINSRRRIPYSLGANPLQPSPKSRMVSSLPSKSENKITADIKRFYDELLPSSNSASKRQKFIAKLEKLLNTEWPGHDIRIHPFGSTENLLCSDDSDVDVCISTPWKKLEDTCMLARFWASHNMERVVCVPGAKVPIVKIWDPEFEIACDMNVNNSLALENTRMVKTYVQIDFRVRQLAMVIKHWAKQRALNDAAGGGTLSSYSWICLIINFLQLRSPPILPALHNLGAESRQEKIVNGVDISFCDDLTFCQDFGKDNKESLGSLLFAFFKWYAFEFDYDHHVVSVRQGRLLSKAEKGWDTRQNNRFCIEEPMITSRNLGNTADDISVKGIQLEFRRAYDILCHTGSLSKCVEKYEYDDTSSRTGLGVSIGAENSSGRVLTRTGSDGSVSSGRSFGRGGVYPSPSYHSKDAGWTRSSNMPLNGVYPLPMYKQPLVYPESSPMMSSSARSRVGSTISLEYPDYVATSPYFGNLYPMYYDGYDDHSSIQAVPVQVDEKANRGRSLSPKRQQYGQLHQQQKPESYDDQSGRYVRFHQLSESQYGYPQGGVHPPAADCFTRSYDSSSDLSDISPEAMHNGSVLATPPECRLDGGFPTDSVDVNDLQLSRLDIGSDEENMGDAHVRNIAIGNDVSPFVAQKNLVDRHVQKMASSDQSSVSSAAAQCAPPTLPKAEGASCSAPPADRKRSSGDGELAHGPVIVNGDMSTLRNGTRAARDAEFHDRSKDVSRSYADAVMSQWSGTSQESNGSVRSTLSGKPALEIGNNQSTKSNGACEPSPDGTVYSFSDDNDDDAEFWAVAAMPGSTNGYHSKPASTLSYSAAASGASSTSKPADAGTGKHTLVMNIKSNNTQNHHAAHSNSKPGQWTTSTSKRSRKKRNAAEKEATMPLVDPDRIVKGG